MARIIFGLIVLFIGISALFGGVILKFLFALILIFLGIRILSGRGARFHHWGRQNVPADTSYEDFINEVMIFGPLNKTVKSENFKGGKTVIVFGSGNIDLSQVKTNEKNINMEFVVVFGGGRLIVPKEWKVNSQGVAVLGEYKSNVGEPAGAVETVLNIKGAAIFGGVEIVN